MTTPSRLLCLVAISGAVLLTCPTLPAQEAFEGQNGSQEFAGNVRTYGLVKRPDLNTQSYEVEVTLTLRGNEGLGSAFLGIGAATPNPEHSDAPSIPPAAFMLVGPKNFAEGPIAGYINAERIEAKKGPGDGTHRLRMTWDAKGKKIRFEIDPNWTEGNEFMAEYEIFYDAGALEFGPEDGIFCGGATGVVFANGTIKPIPSPNY